VLIYLKESDRAFWFGRSTANACTVGEERILRHSPPLKLAKKPTAELLIIGKQPVPGWNRLLEALFLRTDEPLRASSRKFAQEGKLHTVMMQKGQALQPGLIRHLCREQSN
jgi:hypothetical protein